MADGVISNLAAKALESLAKSAFKEAVSWWGARDELKKLENTMTFIQARVRDAERRQEGENSELIRLWLRKLKQVLYRADDLFDDVLTLDRQNPRVERSTLAKVGVLFSKSSPFLNNRKLAHEIKSIRKELDEIKSNMDGLNLSANLVVGLPSPTERLISNRQTGSFVKVEDIIGRENDKNNIIGMLFDPKFDDGKRITVIPIVGFGGLGKTALAQLIYNDEIVMKHFDLRNWVCVPEVGDQNTVMSRVYQSFTGDKDSDRLLVGQIKSGIQESIKDKKYLLVLDDIWDENRNSWLDLLMLLECGASGSRVIVTTRSANVAKAVGTTKVYNLGLLTKDESWNLFKKLAFKLGQEDSNPILTQLGKEIVDSCGNVPLAIRVVGSLLYSENSEREWRRLRDARLSKAKVVKEDDNIMQVLKLSYDYLPPALKQCFAYCSLFPKDYEYSKNFLVKMWMAQGYIDPSSTDTGEQYFIELLGRNLFQEPTEYAEANDVYCKMHDLVHDLAQDIAGEEMKYLVEPLDQISIDGVVHVSVVPNRSGDDGWKAPVSLLAARKIRSFMLSGFNHKCAIKSSSLEVMILKFQSLRVLDLGNMNISMVPNSIGKLRHLRYLNLAMNYGIRSLPDDLTRLQSLQTLDLGCCSELIQLPKDFCKLDSLRHLNIAGCKLSDLPSGFGKMTSLQELDLFIVGKNHGIDSLPPFIFMGSLKIEFCKWRSDAVREAERANLKDNQQLKFLEFKFESIKEAEVTPDLGEMANMLMCLQLPPNLNLLTISGYKGVEMPRRWLDGLSKLVCIRIEYCISCIALPHLSRLPHLKKLYLQFLPRLEYIEDEEDIWVGGGDGSESCGFGTHNVYFPSLEVLRLSHLGSLKGWRRPSKDDDGEPRQLSFPRLLEMTVFECPMLMLMPPPLPQALNLESLEALYINWKVFECNLTLISDEDTSSSLSSPSTTLFTSLKVLYLYRIHNTPASLSLSSRLSNLQRLRIAFCNELTSLTVSNSIQHLEITCCKSLKNVSADTLSVLGTLEILGCWDSYKEELSESIACLTTLQKLTIGGLVCGRGLLKLPEDIGNLSLLHELKVVNCPKMVSLPQSLLSLTSLQRLVILDCPHLKERYKKPNGPDCHLLQHIPIVKFWRMKKHQA